MKKAFFNNPTFLLLALLCLAACRNNTSEAPSGEDAAIIEESEKLDSLSNDLEAMTKTIEEQTLMLQSALDAL